MIYVLAQKVADEIDLSAEEEAALRHTADCDECYHMLCCMMAMQHVAENIGFFAADEAFAPAPAKSTITAILKLTVDKVSAVLDQIEAGMNAWNFYKAPLSPVGMRSAARRAAPVKKLTDEANAKTFIAYDPSKKLLMIQVDASECTAPPKAFLILPDGQQTGICFEKREDLFWAEVHDLEDGNYEITLEK